MVAKTLFILFLLYMCGQHYYQNAFWRTFGEFFVLPSYAVFVAINVGLTVFLLPDSNVVVLLCASETWTLLAADIKLLETFHMKSQRHILTIRWHDYLQHGRCSSDRSWSTSTAGSFDGVMRSSVA